MHTATSMSTKTLRHASLVAAALAACLCAALACAHPGVAEAADGYDQAAARSALSNVNELRANEAWITLSSGARCQLPQALSPYSWDSGLEKVAMLRAKEIAQSFSHMRPNGQDCFSAYTELGVSTPAQGENIAMGYPSAASVVAGWAEASEPYSGQGHRRNMLGGVYEMGSGSVGSVGFTCIGIACYVSNGIRYWVQEFGSERSSSTWERLAGGSALTTMKAVVNEGWSSSTYAVVATSKGYHDALSASGLAGLLKAPVMLTEPNSLSSVTRNLIKSKKVKNVIVVGGTAAISANVEKQIAALGVSVKRVAGGTAATTARKVYKEGLAHGGWGSNAILATSTSYQDALSIAPYAYAKKAPIFLTELGKTTAGAATVKLAKTFARTIVVGGTAAVAASAEKAIPNTKRLAGGTAYTTCKKVADFCLKAGMTVSHVGVATGQSYQDALCGAALLGKKGSILLLVDDKNSDNVGKVLDKSRNDLRSRCYVFGGTSAIGCTLWNKIVGM